MFFVDTVLAHLLWASKFTFRNLTWCALCQHAVVFSRHYYASPVNFISLHPHIHIFSMQCFSAHCMAESADLICSKTPGLSHFANSFLCTFRCAIDQTLKVAMDYMTILLRQLTRSMMLLFLQFCGIFEIKLKHTIMTNYLKEYQPALCGLPKNTTHQGHLFPWSMCTST